MLSNNWSGDPLILRSSQGHPFSDLANILQPFEIPHTGLEDSVIAGLSGLPEHPAPPMEELVQLYCKLTHRDYPIKAWKAVASFSAFRLAVILQGIAARVLKKQASSEEAKVVARGFPPLGRLAEKIAREGDAESGGKSKL